MSERRCSASGRTGSEIASWSPGWDETMAHALQYWAWLRRVFPQWNRPIGRAGRAMGDLPARAVLRNAFLLLRQHDGALPQDRPTLSRVSAAGRCPTGRVSCDQGWAGWCGQEPLSSPSSGASGSVLPDDFATRRASPSGDPRRTQVTDPFAAERP
jgi:hypothetical protein